MTFMGLQASFTAGEISPDLTVRTDLAKYQTGCKLLENMQVMPHGGAVKRSGFEFLGELPGQARLMPFVFSDLQTYVLAFTHLRMFVFTSDGMVVDAKGQPYCLATPYKYDQAAKMSFVQSADVVYLASHDHPPYKLMRYGHADWRLEKMTFAPKITAPKGLKVSLYDKRTSVEITADGVSDTDWEYVVTVLSEDGEESLPCEGVVIKGPQNLRQNCYPKLTWARHAKASEYRVYQRKSGKYGYVGSVDAITEPYFDAKNIAPVMTDTPPSAKNPFENGNNPGTVCFFQQRLVFGGSNKRPQTIWMSRSGNYENFSTSTPLKADDSIEVTIASNEASGIRWMVALRSLLVGTAGVEWEIRGEGDGGAVTPTAISIMPQSYRGSAAINVQVIGNTILHVSRSHREVRDLLYDFGADGYGGMDRAILAAHLFERHKVAGWAYQQSPDSILWIIRDDGVLLGLTYMREHEVFAWHRHTTQGKFKAVACIPGPEGDDVYVVVQRNTGDGNRYFLEKMRQRVVDEESTINAFYVDSGLTYRGNPTKTIYGLNHLQGAEVAILADGAVLPRQKVARTSNGKMGVILPFAASVVHVGLPYSARLKSMGLEAGGAEGGTTVGRKKLVNRICVFFRATNNAFMGTDFAQMDEVKWRRAEPPGTPPKPHTEEAWVHTSLGYQSLAHVCVESREPLPMMILAILPEFSVS